MDSEYNKGPVLQVRGLKSLCVGKFPGITKEKYSEASCPQPLFPKDSDLSKLIPGHRRNGEDFGLLFTYYDLSEL